MKFANFVSSLLDLAPRDASGNIVLQGATAEQRLNVEELAVFSTIDLMLRRLPCASGAPTGRDAEERRRLVQLQRGAEPEPKRCGIQAPACGPPAALQ